MNNLNTVRKDIDAIDKQIIKLLSERFKKTSTIGILKKNSLILKDIQREKEIFIELDKLSSKFNLNPNLIKNIYKLILTETLKNHHKL